jgi:long-chain acyl-CoA synthetase
MAGKNIFQVLQDTAAARGAHPCVKFKTPVGYETLTLAQFTEKVLRLRYLLLKAGVRPGSRVAILLTNGPLWPVAFFGITSIQAVAVPIDIQLGVEEIKNILSHSEARIILTEEKFGIALGDMLAGAVVTRPLFLDRISWAGEAEVFFVEPGRSAFSPRKLAALFYTSGTTSEHKAVMLTHANLLANLESVRGTGLITPDDVLLSVLPLHHTYPFMTTCLAPVLLGATVCYLPSLMQHEIFSCLKENRVTIFIGVPQIYSLLSRGIGETFKKRGALFSWSINRALDVGQAVSRLSRRDVVKNILSPLRKTLGPDLKFMVSGGAKLDPDVARDFFRWGYRMAEGYGLTETSPVVTLNPMDPKKFGSVGKPVAGVQVKISQPGEDGAGEIAVCGANVMLGYYRALPLTRDVIKDGWFFTGDVGRMDRDGFLTITGRKNELIVFSSGKKASPEKIEDHYLECPFIKEICVFLVKKGPEAGRLIAVIVPDEDLLKKTRHHMHVQFKIRWELDSRSQKIPPYQRIHGFVLTSQSLPRTRLGKLLRYQIASQYAAGAFKGEVRKPDSDLLSPFEQTALKYLSRILKKEVQLEDHLELDLGLDSLGRIELLSSLQEMVSVGIDDTLALELFGSRTVRDLLSKAHQALPEDAFSGLLKREDAIFWSDVLKNPPSAASVKKLKLQFDAFDRMISYLVFWSLKLFFRVFFLVRLKGKAHFPAEGPFVITPNHVTYLDAFFALCALPNKRIINTYFVGFSEILTHPLLAWAIRFNRLIPIDANLDLAETLKVCRYILGQGKTLVYFPEGQRSGDGQVKEFRKGIGILLKESGAKVLPMYLDGAYSSWPRTRVIPLPSRVTVLIGPCLEVRELESGPASEDMYMRVAKNLQQKVVELEPQRRVA